MASEQNISEIGTKPIIVIELEDKKEWFTGNEFLIRDNISVFVQNTLDNRHERDETLVETSFHQELTQPNSLTIVDPQG